MRNSELSQEKRFFSARVKDTQRGRCGLWPGESHEMMMQRKERWRRKRVCEDMSEVLELFAIFRNLSLPMNTVTKNQSKYTW